MVLIREIGIMLTLDQNENVTTRSLVQAAPQLTLHQTEKHFCANSVRAAGPRKQTPHLLSSVLAGAMSSVEDYGCSGSEMSWAAASTDEDDEADYLIDNSSPQLSARTNVAAYTIIDRHQLERIQVRICLGHTPNPIKRVH